MCQNVNLSEIVNLTNVFPDCPKISLFVKSRFEYMNIGPPGRAPKTFVCCLLSMNKSYMSYKMHLVQLIYLFIYLTYSLNIHVFLKIQFWFSFF